MKPATTGQNPHLADMCLIPSFRDTRRGPDPGATADKSGSWGARYHLLQDLFDSAPGAYLTTGFDGVIHQANQTAGILFDVDPYFLIGKPLAVFVPLDQRRAFRTTLIQLRRNPRALTWVGVIKPRRASARPVSFAVRTASRDYPISDEIFWLIHDLTEIGTPAPGAPIATPKPVAGAATTASVPVATLSSLARDLRNPLSIIADQAGFLTEVLVGFQPGDSEQVALGLAGLVDLSHEVISALDEIADYAAFRSGAPLALNPGPSDLIAVVQRVVGAVRRANEHRPIDLVVEHGALRGIIAAWDEDRLERALGNILEEVADVCQDASTIGVRLDRHDEVDATRAAITVTWTPADAPIFLGRAWDQGRTRGRLRREGLGISGAKWIIEQLGGSLREERRRDGTAAVFVELRYNAGPTVAEPNAAAF